MLPCIIHDFLPPARQLVLDSEGTDVNDSRESGEMMAGRACVRRPRPLHPRGHKATSARQSCSKVLKEGDSSKVLKTLNQSHHHILRTASVLANLL